MACERYREELTEVAAGAPARSEVEGHLASCGTCRAELALLRRALGFADAALGELLSAEPSPLLRARILDAAGGDASAARARFPWQFGSIWPAVAAALSLLLALALWTGRGVLLAPRPRSASVARTRLPLAPQATVVPGAAAAALPRTVLPSAPALVGPSLPLSSPRHDTRPSPPAVAAGPEVLVPRGECDALLRLVALVHREGITPPVLGLTGHPSADLAGPPSIDIQPLEIVPLDPAEASGT